MEQFIKQETGAVTVDWVVLTAALVGLGLATMSVVSSGVEDASTDVQTKLYDNSIITTAFMNTDYCAIAKDYMIHMYNADTPDAQSEARDMCEEHQDHLYPGNETSFWVYQRDYHQAHVDEADAMMAEIDRQLAQSDTLDFDALAAVYSENYRSEGHTFTAQQMQGDFLVGGQSDPLLYRQVWQYQSDYNNALVHSFNTELAKRDDYTPS